MTMSVDDANATSAAGAGAGAGAAPRQRRRRRRQGQGRHHQHQHHHHHHHHPKQRKIQMTMMMEQRQQQRQQRRRLLTSQEQMEISYQRAASLLRHGLDLDIDDILSPPGRFRHGNDYSFENVNNNNSNNVNDTKLGNIDYATLASSSSSSSSATAAASSSRINNMNNIITVIPSLVSLSADFFLSAPPPAAASASKNTSASAASASASDSASWGGGHPPAILTPRSEEEARDFLMEQNQNHPRHRHRDQHSHPSVTLRPRPAAAAAAAAAATASNTIDQLNITIGHHTSNYNGFFQYNNYYDNDDDDDDPPPEDWPLGPQGAPIPSHLLLLHHTLSDSPLMGDGTRHRHHHHHHHHNSYHHGSTFLDEDADAGAEGGESNREDNALSTTAIQRAPSIAGAAEASASAASTSNANNIMDSMPPFLPSTLTSPSSPSPPFGQRRQQQRPDDTTNNNNSGWGWRERRFHHHQHQQQNHHRQLSQHQQPQTFSPTPPPSVAVYINAVKFLDHAVTRLENKLSSTQSSSSSSSSSSGNSNANNTANPNITTPQQPQNIEELESKLLIRLVEIMLHPPTTTMCTPTTVMTDDNSSNGWEHNEYDCSCHEDDGNEESSSGGTLDDGDDLEVDDDDDDDEDVMTMTGASSSGETNSSELRTILTIPATFVPNNKSSPAMSPLNQQPHYPTIASAKLAIQQLGQMIPQRRVCQYAFKRNDIVWVCRTCQSDETCVLCHECFRNSNHEGHDVAFYHAQAGGCCDCGDEDAWSPKGFCGRHGGPATTSNNCLGNDDVENPTKLMLNNVEPAVLGAVCAIADYLAVVVRSGVEGGYRRANPSSLFHGATTSASPFGAEMTATIADDILPHITAPRGSSSDDTLLPEYYDEDDGGRDRRHQRDFRRDHSFHRRSTVADMESVSAAPLPMLHEAQFNPSLASTSSSASQRRSSNQSSKEVDMIDTPTFNKVFDPNAAGSSSSSSSSSKFTSTTPNCGAAKMVCDGAHLEPDNATQYETSEVRSPARALGDLGREEHGLFLVLHCDEIHMGPPSSSSSHHYSSNSRSEVIAALKELYSAPGGGGKVGDAASVSAGIYHFTDIGRGGGDGGTHSFGPTNRFTRQPDRLLLSPTRYSLFRAPQAEAILDRIVQIVKSQGDLIVWGTQEILAECGDVTARLWCYGDPHCSTLIGAAVLNRARILTDRGLVCSIKTRKNLCDEQKATAALRLIGWMASSCDPLCDQVSLGILGRRAVGTVYGGGGGESALMPMLRNDLKLPYQFVMAWHSLLLTLLAVPNFKAAMANAYCDTYREVTAEYSRGVGLIERSSYTLSVQFLNRVSYVTDLVRERNLLFNLSRCLLETMRMASFIPGSPGSPPPAGSSSDTMNDLDARITPSASLTAALLAILGSFSSEGGDEANIARLDSEINELILGMADVSGGDSRHHGRSAISKNTGPLTGNGKDIATHRYLLERTAALVLPTLDPSHTVLSHRRYSVCISDLKCVLNVNGMARYFASLPIDQKIRLPSATSTQGKSDDYSTTISTDRGITSDCPLNDWIQVLSLAQQMDGQMWRPWVKGHVESEPKGWVGAFNASISLSSLFERLLSWDDTDPSPIKNCNLRSLSCVELTHYILTVGLLRWQRSEMLSYRPTKPPSCHPHPPEYALSPASLPFSTVASAHGSVLAMAAIPLPQIAVWSFHLPLHRFAASCIREVSRRNDNAGESGLAALLDMLFAPPAGENVSTQLRLNTLFVRGLMEFPAIVLSRAAQIRAGIWKRNGPGMNDQVLNYSEPPFCRPLADADMLLLQFALLCHTSRVAGNAYTMDGVDSDEKNSIARLAFAGNGTARLVNLLLHRFGVFDFLGFEKAPTANVDQYKNELSKGLYPPEIEADVSDESFPELVLPWTYCPAPDPTTCLNLVQELMHIIILLITEMPPPSPLNFSEHALEAKRRLKREVIHRLASGNKTHSEMAEVSCVLSQRDNAVLCKTFVSPDDASGAALEDALSEVAVRKQKSGAPDEWELRKDAWKEYDPAFHHISTRSHQSATENRPKPSSSSAYAPRPAPAHLSFKRIRRDLTADSCILAMAYRILHVHCYENHRDYPPSDTQVRGDLMYEENSKSETVLARAVHLLTLGAYAWEDARSSDRANSADWRDLGGGSVGSIFYNREIAPSTCDWVTMALLREPSEVMNCNWYVGKENALTLLKKIGFEVGDCSGFLGGVDPALRSGAAFLCEFAARYNPDAASASGKESCRGSSPVKEGEQERKKNAAKEKAMALMKAQMARFAANIENSPGFDDEDGMSEDNIDESRSPSRGSNVASAFSTPIRNRSDSEVGVLSPTREFKLSSPISSLNSPYTPRTPHMTTPRTTSQNAGMRLMHERPQCIVCGGDSHDPMQADVHLSAGSEVFDGFTSNEKALAFCGYSQASTVIMGGDGVPTRGRISSSHFQCHVGVHITLCGHAIHKDCCDAYLKTVASQRFDRLEGSKKRDFRCPLCQRLSNCLVPFVDVAADWTERVMQNKLDASSLSTSFASDDDSLMLIDGIGKPERTQLVNADGRASLDVFLSTSKWWATRNDKSVAWDGQCTFSVKKDDSKPSELPHLSSPRQSLMKLQSKFGKKELVSAWNSVLRTPRLVTRRVRSADRSPSCTHDPNEGSRQKESNSDVLRRFLDQVSDVSHRADMRRLGEENLFNNFGEFRHYLSEKAAYNKDNRAAGKEMVDWPLCLSTSTTLTESRRQELSREKLISKMMLSIQAFTYTCCSEAAEARQLLRESSEPDKPSILSKFGISNVSIGGDLLLFPEANPSVDGGYQPFDGRLGKLRYLSLALMAATSPVSLEVVHLCMSFPESQPDPFDFCLDEKSLIKRAPVAYPILCSHVLTHTTGALIAVCGRARAEEGRYSIDSVVEDCRHLIQLGLIARLAQVILARLRLHFDDDVDWEQPVYAVIQQNMMQLIASVDDDEQNWRHFGVVILHTLLSPAISEFQPAVPSSHDADAVSSHVLHAIEAAKTEVISFLRDLALICQLLVPNIFCSNLGSQHDSHGDDSTIDIIKRYMTLFNMESHKIILESNLLQEILKSWYARSTGKITNQLDFPRVFHGTTWPVTPCVSEPEIPTNSVHLLGNSFFGTSSDNGLSPRIMYLPTSYTDLYATLSELYPDSEQTAVCLVCGQVLNAAGKGECTKHTYKCGGGAGIYFLVQECVGLIIHEHKAAYVHSPYVDYFGETPQYRGRPLNLNMDRYHIMQSLWSGHLIREKVIAERASTRQVIIPNFY